MTLYEVYSYDSKDTYTFNAYHYGVGLNLALWVGEDSYGVSPRGRSTSIYCSRHESDYHTDEHATMMRWVAFLQGVV